MNIKSQITLLFLLSFTIMIILSLWTESINESKNDKIVASHYLNLAKELLPAIVDNNQALLKRKNSFLNLNIGIQSEGDILVRRPITFGEIIILKTKIGYTLKITYLDEIHIFEDHNIELFNQEQMVFNILIVFDIVILLLIYIAMMKIIAPIHQLSLTMKRFSQGEFDLQVPLKGANEIRELSSNFNQMSSSLKEAIEERENLLKYIGHELKTPLAKSKFALEMNQPEILGKSLDDMDRLVNNILEMHLLKADKLNISTFKVQTLVTQALNRLYIEDESLLEIKLNDFEIKGDLEYLSVALKNLIDNGLKYGEQKPVLITTKPYIIEVISKGKALTKPFQFYLEAFTQEESTKLGYGLGLNIVKRVLTAHNFNLSYKYKDNKNIFRITFKT